jgi:hypothetical protein
MSTKINVNDSVWVKLTDAGKLIHRREHDAMRQQFPSLGRYKPPKQYPGGYAKFQMWELMQYFGPHISLGAAVPFDTEILLTEPQP